VKSKKKPAMIECSKYQLLLHTDYVRLREKYDHLYIYSHILSYIALRESSQIFFFKTKDSCPVEYSDGCCKTIAACETVVDRNSTGSLLSKYSWDDSLREM
jgi:hypothetical protein